MDSNDGYEYDLYVKRVDQLDAKLLDRELDSLITSQITNIVNSLQIRNNFLEHVEPELKLCVRLFLWKMTTLSSRKATVGQNLMRMRFMQFIQNTSAAESLGNARKSRLAMLTFSSVILPWIGDRLTSSQYVKRNYPKIVSSHERLCDVYRILDLINFVLFLDSGLYRTLSERLLGLPCVAAPNKSSVDEELMEVVNCEYASRELMWTTFAQFLTFVLPLINFYRIKNLSKSLMKKLVPSKDEDNRLTKSIMASSKDLTECPICGEWPHNAHQFNGCVHVFCYSCLMGAFLSDTINGFSCPLCQHQVSSAANIRRFTRLL